MLKKTYFQFIISLIVFPCIAFAGSFQVSPLKLYLEPGAKTIALTVSNKGDEKATMQINAGYWVQDEKGADTYQDTEDIIFFPKIVDIEKGEERVIRIGFKGEKSKDMEKAYRLFLQELPVSKAGELKLKMAIKIGVPIFIKPDSEKKEVIFEKVDLSPDGMVRLTVKNSGNTHFVVGKMNATGYNESDKDTFSVNTSGWYVLPGIAKEFLLKVNYDECVNTKIIKASFEVDKKSYDAQGEINTGKCLPPPEDDKKEK